MSRRLPNGMELTDSIESEHFCLRLLAGFGLPVARTEIADFAGTRAPVIERFDRLRARDGRLIRLPQENCCQALSVPPTRKYQNEGGPGIVEICDLLTASDEPQRDRAVFLKAVILFWLIGATDGHAKNFSIALKRWPDDPARADHATGRPKPSANRDRGTGTAGDYLGAIAARLSIGGATPRATVADLNADLAAILHRPRP